MLSIMAAFSSPELKAFPLCSKSSNSSEGGQMSCLLSSELSAAAIASAHISAQPRQARLCDLFRSASAALHKSHRLANVRIKVVKADVLSDCCARAGKTLISRSNPSASGSCRALRACLLWHLPSVSASASRTRKPPSNTIGQRELTDASASVLNSPSCPARMKQWCIISMVVNQQLRSWSASYVLKTYYRCQALNTYLECLVNFLGSVSAVGIDEEVFKVYLVLVEV